MSTVATPPAADNRQRPGPQDLLRTLSLETYERARDAGMTLSQWLEAEDPSERYKEGPERGMDAFQRLLMAADIKTAGHPRGEYLADEVKAFEKDDHTRALFPEFLFRVADSVRNRSTQQRAPFLSSDVALNTMLRPYADDMTPRWDMTEPAIPLSELIAGTRVVDGDKTRSIHITRTAANLRKKRVAEAAEIPGTKIATSEQFVPLYKYGIHVETTYEQLRRFPIDLVAWFIRLEAMQAETDKVVAALDVIVNGDGNANTSATEYDLTTLDPAATPGVLSLKGWLAFKGKFEPPYGLTGVLANEDMILQLLLLNLGSANVLLGQRADFGSFTPMNRTFADGVRWGISADAPDDKIVGIDRRFGIGRLVERGSQISEVERYMSRQVERLYITETEGFEVRDPRALKILDVST